MKRKLLLLAAFVASALGMRAQTDVFKDITDGKISNPSFEGNNATVSDTPSSGSTSTSITGWTFTQDNGRIAVFNSTSSDDTYGASSPSNDSYYVRIRTAGGSNSGTQTLISANAFSMQKGTYRVSFDYKAGKVHNYAKNFTVSAMDGSTSLGSKQNSIPKANKSDTYFSSIIWTTDTFSFSLTETKGVKIKVVCDGSSNTAGRTVLALDNFVLEWNLTKSLADLLTEANTYYNEHTSYSALKTAIDNADAVKTSSDANVLETQYNDLSSALSLAQAQVAWQAVHDVLAGKELTVLPTAAANAITTELAKAVPTTTADAVNEAKDALQALIDSYDGIKTAYAKVKALITLATNEKIYSAGIKTTIENAINTATTNIETRDTATALEGDYTTLENARQTYVTSGAEPTAGHSFDLTFKITNPGFEQGSKTGWTLTDGHTGNMDFTVKSDNPYEGSYYLNAWAQQIEYLQANQKLTTLPKGSYNLKAFLYSSQKREQHIYANTTDKANSSSNLSVNDTWEQKTVDFTQVTDNANVNIGVYSYGKNENKNTEGWYRADQFQLYYIGYKPILQDLIDKATTLSTSNIGTDVFQIPSSAAEALTTAIAIAQAVLDDDNAYGDAITTAINDLNTAITNFQGATLNAPDSEKRYYLTVVRDGKDWDGNAITFMEGAANPTQGNYGIKYLTPANANMCQAVKFTNTTGNKYKVSFLTPAGTEQYITTSNLGYNAGTDNTNKERIRTVDDASKALEIEIQATTTANQFRLYNTDRGAVIADNNNNDVYTNNSANFTISEASQASVGLSVKAGKWATRIFPFNPTLPAGVVAYTAEVNGNSLNLTEVASPAANVPYILKNTTESDVNENLSGYGTAKQDAYTTKTTSVDLTGIYTAASIPVGSYVLQTQSGAQGFYQTDAAITGVAYRVYLTVPGTASVKAFYLDFDDTTGIDSMNGAIEGLLEGEVYDLSGRLVKNPTRGIYIVNGKKVLIK